MPGLFHGVNDPVPVAGGFEGNLAGGRQTAQELAIEIAVMIDADRPGSLAVLIDGAWYGEVFVSVTSNDWLHGASYVRPAYPAAGCWRFHRFTPSTTVVDSSSLNLLCVILRRAQWRSGYLAGSVSCFGHMTASRGCLESEALPLNSNRDQITHQVPKEIIV
jgi:hypothetical protein